LQVLVPDEEFALIKAAATTARLTVGEYVRQELRRSVDDSSMRPAEAKLRAIERAMAYSFPAPGIEQMNAEIEQGYTSGLH
jgi:hypothetical protein